MRKAETFENATGSDFISLTLAPYRSGGYIIVANLSNEETRILALGKKVNPVKEWERSVAWAKKQLGIA